MLYSGERKLALAGAMKKRHRTKFAWNVGPSLVIGNSLLLKSCCWNQSTLDLTEMGSVAVYELIGSGHPKIYGIQNIE